MKKSVLFLLMFFAICGVRAQNLNQIRCSIDDVSNVVGEYNIDVEDVYEGNLEINIGSLSNGLHYLYIQVKDSDGHWTHFAIHPFQVAGSLQMATLSSMEYFFDIDPGQGNGYALLLDNEEVYNNTLTFAIPEDLSFGLHNLYVRSRDNGGQWSHCSVSTIQIAGSTEMATLQKVEYFYDEDPGIGNADWILTPLLSEINEDMAIPVPIDLSLGNHNLYIRCADAGNQWSHYTVVPVTICETYAPTASFITNRYQGGYYVELVNNSELATELNWTIDGINVSGNDSLFHYFTEPGLYEVCLDAINSCGQDQYCDTIVVNGISDFFAQAGNNTGIASVTIRGGFVPDADVRLIRNGYSDIIATEVVFWNEGELRVLFDLRGQALGDWQLSVDMGSEGYFIAGDAYQIIEGQPAEINVELIGIRVGRAGRVEPYHLVVENFGDEDAIGVPILIRQAPVSIATVLEGDSLETIDLNSESFFTALLNEQQETGFDPALISPFSPSPIDDTYGYAYIIPQVPAHGSVQLDFTIECDAPGFQFNGRTSFRPWLKSTASLPGETDIANPHCRSAEFRQVLEEIAGTTFDDVDWENCFNTAYDEAIAFLAEKAQNAGYNTTQLIPLPAYNAAILHACATCMNVNPDADQWEEAMGRFDRLSKFMTVDQVNCEQVNPELMPVVIRTSDAYQSAHERVFDCAPGGGGGGGGGGFSSGAFMGGLNPANRDAFENLCRILSSDPNTKEGPIANGAWINGVMNIPYQVWFENADTATAAAQTVIIRDTLDISRFELSSFEWLGFGFSGNFYSIPQGRQNHYEVVDLRPEMPNLLKFTGTYDALTGIAEATFQTLDTLTLEPTTDPFQGFLPPNVEHPIGQGFVGFRLNNIEGLSSGDIISNTAEIIFDENEPILTGAWDLYFDDVRPDASFTNASEVNTSTFNLFWSEFDAHSGIEHIEIYAILDNQPHLFAIVNAGIGELEVVSSFGSILEFGILSYDFAGNVQEEMQLIEVSVIDNIHETTLGGIAIYPNPADELLQVLVSHPQNEKWIMRNSLGQKVLSGTFNQTLQKLDVAGLSPGAYTMQYGEDVLTIIIH